MNWKSSTIAVLLLASAFSSSGAPVTYKEIAMLIRNREKERFIFSEAETRKLLQPLTKQEENTLLGLGATPALLNALRSPTLLAPPDVVAAYKARMQKQQESSEPPALPQAPLPTAVTPPPAPSPQTSAPRVSAAAGVAAAKNARPIVLSADIAFRMSQLDAAKAKAIAEKKPLGFIMVWGQYFGNGYSPRLKGGQSALAHFYHAFNDSLVLVFVRHETELGSVPAAVKTGFFGPDEGGFAPNMAVVDATASQFIVEIPMGGANADGPVRDVVFAAGAAKIDQWLAAHPDATAPAP